MFGFWFHSQVRPIQDIRCYILSIWLRIPWRVIFFITPFPISQSLKNASRPTKNNRIILLNWFTILLLYNFLNIFLLCFPFCIFLLYFLIYMFLNYLFDNLILLIYSLLWGYFQSLISCFILVLFVRIWCQFNIWLLKGAIGHFLFVNFGGNILLCLLRSDILRSLLFCRDLIMDNWLLFLNYWFLFYTFLLWSFGLIYCVIFQLLWNFLFIHDDGTVTLLIWNFLFRHCAIFCLRLIYWLNLFSFCDLTHVKVSKPNCF